MTKYSCNKCSWWIATSDIIQCCAECGSSEVIVIFEGEENEKVVGSGSNTGNSSRNSSSDMGDSSSHNSGESLNAV